MQAPTLESISELRDAFVFDLLPGSLVLFSNEINQIWDDNK
jgi:hypothetical protein